MTNTEKITFDLPTKYESDVIVVGGGPAGFAASVAAARHGLKTILIEQYGCIGGMSTVSLVGPFVCSFDAKGEKQVVKGIFDELVNRMVEMGGAIHPSQVKASTPYSSFIDHSHHNTTPFDPEVMKHISMEMVLEAGVMPKLHTKFIGARMKDDRTVGSIILVDKTGLFLAKAKIFIDTSGDADLSASSGCAIEKGRSTDGKLQPASMFFRIAGVNDERVAQWKAEHPDERLFASIVAQGKETGEWPANCARKELGLFKTPRDGEWRVNTSRLLDIDGTDPESLTRAEIEGRRQAWDLLRFFNKRCPGLENAYIVDLGHQIGIRETRRVVGLYWLTKEDAQYAKRFDDAIARFGYYMDIHNPSGGGQEGQKIGKWFDVEGDYYEIPYRCLVPKDVDNLLVAGRCLSADRYANGSLRCMPACFATGQAAGTAAFMSITNRCTPSAVDGVALRKTLKNDGAYV